MTDNSQLATYTAQPHGHGKEVGMATRDQRRDGWTVVLRRQPARIVDGRPEGPYTDAFEIICCDCGDDPGLEYTEVSPKLQLIRGPYPIAVGIAAYETHLKLHCQTGAGASDGDGD
jgi:hypothetical protein